MPLTFTKVIRRMNALVEIAGASIPHRFSLFDHTTKWNMEVYLAVDRKILSWENVTLNRTFLNKVYDGPYENTGKLKDDFHLDATRQGLEIKKWSVLYTTCPTCSKKYGKNYVTIVAEVSRSAPLPPII